MVDDVKKADVSEKNEGQDGNSMKKQAPIVPHIQFIRDFSFEIPHCPDIFLELQQENKAPEIEQNFDVHVVRKGQDTYDVTINFELSCKQEEKQVFLLELSYGGMFSIQVPEKHIKPVLFIECPRILFPFLRQIVADITSNAGFLPVMLQPMNFVELFQKKVDEATQAKQEEEGNNSSADESIAAESAGN